MTKPLPRPYLIILILLMLGYATFFSIQLFLHYDSFGSRAQDLGNMDQAIWNTLHGRWFHQTNQPGATSRLSLHVEPILLPISLLYLIHSGPKTLFVLQSVVVALGAIPVMALARRKLGRDDLALLFAAVYLLFPAVQAATLLDFHPVTLAPTFMLAAFYYLETRQSGKFTLFAALAVGCKEDMTLLIMMMGLYALVINRQRRLGLTTIALTGLWAWLAVFVIPPLFAGTENIHWDRYSHLGETTPDKLINLFFQPGLYLSHLQQVNVPRYLHLLLAPAAYTALFNPITLLLALPSLGINLLSNFEAMQEVNALIYAVPIAPAVIISSIYGTANLLRVGESAMERISDSASQRVKKSAGLVLGGLILAASLIYHVYYGYFPGGGKFRGWEEVTDHHRRGAQIFAQVPPDAALAAHDRLNPHVSQRETLFIFDDRLEQADHILLDVSEDSWPLHPVELRHRVDDFLNSGFGIVDAFDGYLLLAKDPALPTTLPNRFFDFARIPNAQTFQPAYPTSVIFDDRLELLGYNLELGAHDRYLPVITMYWHTRQPLDTDYNLWPFVLDRQGRVIETVAERPLVATLWYPTSRWQPGEIIVTRTLPRDLAPNIGDEFTVAVGVTRGDWNDPAQQLPITGGDNQLYRFEKNTWTRLNSFVRTGRRSYQPVPDDPAPPELPQPVQFWNLISLRGVDPPDLSAKAGDELSFTLHWQAEAPITVNLKTFVHLLNESGETMAQLDWIPQDAQGRLPTSAWQPVHPVVDRQHLPLPADLPPGEYRLVVGWYYPPTGERLPLTAGGDGDTITVAEISVR